LLCSDSTLPRVRVLPVLRSRSESLAPLSTVLPAADLVQYDRWVRTLHNHRDSNFLQYGWNDHCIILTNCLINMHEKWDEYYLRGWGVDPELAREKLDFLRLEQERAMFNPQEMWDKDDEPLFYANTLHPLDFSCQCKACVRLHTITMKDRDFLRSIGIAWRATIMIGKQA